MEFRTVNERIPPIAGDTMGAYVGCVLKWDKKNEETNNRGTRVFGARVVLSKQLVDEVSKWAHRFFIFIFLIFNESKSNFLGKGHLR